MHNVYERNLHAIGLSGRGKLHFHGKWLVWEEYSFQEQHGSLSSNSNYQGLWSASKIVLDLLSLSDCLFFEIDIAAGEK